MMTKIIVRPQRIAYTTYIKRTIATDDHVAWCVSLSVTRLHCANTAERIEVLFGWRLLGTQAQCMRCASRFLYNDEEEEWGEI